ncbi:MAG: acetyltransferase [Acidimicrobiales bacterium]|nr:acetyltransferase [Acidimicrobiales bacterium]
MAVGDRRRPGVHPLRVSTWRGDEGIAVVSPVPDRPPPTDAAIRATVAGLAAQGVHRVVTSALGPTERAGFEAAGFAVQEQLYLLSHDLVDIRRGRADVQVRRARATDRPAILGLDHRAFEPFWRLDGRGLDEAVAATPSSRFRVATTPDVVGYAIWGRAADRGYLQRLAAEPDRHRQGIGTALVADGLRWLRRHSARRAVVNTQEGNEGALAAYLALGFRLEPDGLAVLHLDLPSGSA